MLDMLPNSGFMRFSYMLKLRDIIDTMHETAVNIYDQKKQLLLAGDDTMKKQIGQGKDIISILSMSSIPMGRRIFLIYIQCAKTFMPLTMIV